MAVRARQPSYDLMSGSPTGGNTVGEITNNLNDNVVLRELRAAIDNGWSVFDMQAGFGDEFHDETGIATNNLVYDASGDYYQPTPAAAPTLLVQSGGDSNGSTSFIDSGGTYTVTANGNAQHSTAQAKFSTSSMYFDGTGDYLSVADAAGLEPTNQDFTVEGWVYITSLAANIAWFGKWGGSGNRSLQSQVQTDGTMRTYLSTNGLAVTHDTGSGSVVMAVNTWYHLAVCRSGSTIRQFVNGVEDGTIAISTNSIHDNGQSLVIGARNTTPDLPLTGYMEEFYYDIGSAKYTTGFTPPTSPYSLSPTDGSITSVSKTANTQPDTARIVSLHEPVDSVTLNTDVTFEVSRDGGTTWTEATMSNDLTILSTLNMLSSGDIDISSQPTGTTMKLKATTANSKEQRFHAWALQWR
jgi:hypothetical protein